MRRSPEFKGAFYFCCKRAYPLAMYICSLSLEHSLLCTLGFVVTAQRPRGWEGPLSPVCVQSQDLLGLIGLLPRSPSFPPLLVYSPRPELSSRGWCVMYGLPTM